MSTSKLRLPAARVLRDCRDGPCLWQDTLSCSRLTPWAPATDGITSASCPLMPGPDVVDLDKRLSWCVTLILRGCTSKSRRICSTLFGRSCRAVSQHKQNQHLPHRRRRFRLCTVHSHHDKSAQAKHHPLLANSKPRNGMTNTVHSTSSLGLCMALLEQSSINRTHPQRAATLRTAKLRDKHHGTRIQSPASTSTPPTVCSNAAPLLRFRVEESQWRRPSMIPASRRLQWKNSAKHGLLCRWAPQSLHRTCGNTAWPRPWSVKAGPELWTGGGRGVATASGFANWSRYLFISSAWQRTLEATSTVGQHCRGTNRV